MMPVTGLAVNVRILYFGATADIAGTRREEMELPSGSRATDAFARIIEARPELSKHKLLFSVNQEYASGDEAISEGDELAVFTAVSGG